jgi:hypothetical protein
MQKSSQGVTSGFLRGVNEIFVLLRYYAVLGQPIGHIFKVQAVQELFFAGQLFFECSILEDETNGFPGSANTQKNDDVRSSGPSLRRFSRNSQAINSFG